MLKSGLELHRGNGGPMEVPLEKWKWLSPFKDEITGPQSGFIQFTQRNSQNIISFGSFFYFWAFKNHFNFNKKKLKIIL